MRLSTSTNICAFYRGEAKNNIPYCVRQCARAGYRVLDVNFCEAMNPGSRLRAADWEDYVRGIAEESRALGVEFSQSHLPYYDVFGADEATRDLYEELIRRSIIASGVLGVRWAVTHPATLRGRAADPGASIAANLDYFGPHLALARSLGVGLALENDFEYRSPPWQRTLGAAAHELAALVDAFRDPQHLGACYDFGHANLTGGFIRQDLRALGSRLKATHVADNHGTADEHLLPFHGTIDWVSAMEGLAEIGYGGDLTYEIQEFGRGYPNEYKHLVIEASLRVGEILLGYAGEARRRLDAAEEREDP